MKAYRIGIYVSVAVLLMIVYCFISVFVVLANNKCAENTHKYEQIEKKNPTQTADGYMIYICEVCEDTYTKIEYAKGHKWGNWVVEQEPSCDQTGEKKRTCSVGAKHSERKEMPATGHDYGKKTVDAGCETSGSVNYTCKLCADTYSENYGQATGHDYEEIINKQPSCKQEGQKTFTCLNCGNTYTEPILQKEHNYSEWTVVKAAMPGVEGLEYRQCVDCEDRVEQPIDALPREQIVGEAEILITTANALVWVVSGVILYSDIVALIWIRNKKKEVLRSKQNQEDYGYESF